VNAPPNTLAYMIAGYGVILGVLAAYIASLALRWHRLKRRAQKLNGDNNLK